MLKISLLTDLHIDVEGFLFHGKNARINFIDVLHNAVSKNPNLVVLAGDLCNKAGNLDIYHWIKKHMDATGIPYLCIPGNHDDAILMKEVFYPEEVGSENELYFIKEWNSHSLIFLDSSQSKMSDEQYIWLKSKVNESKENVIIFMHHPPVLAGAKHMEPKFAFQQMDEFQALCAGFQDKVFTIFTGHYHLERTIQNGNITTFISPSTYLQIHPDFEEFRLYHNRIGYREITLGENGLVTYVSYLAEEE